MSARVQVRLIGQPDDVERMLDELRKMPGVRLASVSSPRRSRREGGDVLRYLDALLEEQPAATERHDQDPVDDLGPALVERRYRVDP